MAKTKMLGCTIGMTMNVGNFESLKLELSEHVVLEEGDDREKEQTSLRIRVQKRLDTEADKLLDKYVSKTEEPKKGKKK